MSQGWRQKGFFHAAEEEVGGGSRRSPTEEVTLGSSSRRKSRSRSGSPSSKHSFSTKHKHHRHHKHRHHHKKDKRRSKSPRGRRSRSRSKSRDRDIDGGGRKRDRESGSRYSQKRRKSRSGSRPRVEFPRGGRDGRRDIPNASNYNTSTSSNDDLDLDAHQPFSTTAVPAAGSKLKAEIERRKQLWSKKDKPEEAVPAQSTSVWKQTAFSGDNDGKVSAKFKRLMGIKEGLDTGNNSGTSGTSTKSSGNPRQEVFENLEKQYEVARAATHTQRGLGLGFSSRLFPG